MDLFKSKKFIMAGIGLVAVVLSFFLDKFGVHVDDAKMAEFLATIAAYLLGQGIADHGKEAAAIQAEALKALPLPPSLPSKQP